MSEYMKGWKRVEEVEIPRVQKKGFTENVLIRKFIPPVDETEEEIESYFGEEPTVLLQQDTKICAFLKRKKTGEIVEIAKPEFVIGKSAEADYVIKDNPTISRKHLKIIQKEDGYWMEDLQSANHSYVNEKEMKEPVRLVDEMKFRLSSDEEFEFMIRLG